MSIDWWHVLPFDETWIYQPAQMPNQTSDIGWPLHMSLV